MRQQTAIIFFCLANLLLACNADQGNDSEELSTERDITSPSLLLLDIHQPSDWSDFELCLLEANNQNKPVLIDFTGYSCVNCRKMEEFVWLDPTVFPLLQEHFYIVSLYVDSKEVVTVLNMDGSMKSEQTVGDIWFDYEKETYEKASQPVYDIVDSNQESLVGEVATYSTHLIPEDFAAWLEEGLSNFKK